MALGPRLIEWVPVRLAVGWMRVVSVVVVGGGGGLDVDVRDRVVGWVDMVLQ